MELRETAVSPGTGTVEIDAAIMGVTPSGRPRPHYRTRVTLCSEPAEPPAVARPHLPGTVVLDGPTIYTDGTLFHGPWFQGVRRVLRLDEAGLTLECELPPLPESVQGQFPVGSINPYVADTLFVAPVVWMRQMRGVASLPLAAERVEMYGELRFGTPYLVTVEVRESGPMKLRCDATAFDTAGRIRMRLLGAEVGASPDLDRLFVPARTV
jgi:hypothetical protein